MNIPRKRHNRRGLSSKSLCEALESRVLLSALPAATWPSWTLAVQQAELRAEALWDEDDDDSFWDDPADDFSEDWDNSGSYWDDLFDPDPGPSTQPGTQPDTQPDTQPSPWPEPTPETPWPDPLPESPWPEPYFPSPIDSPSIDDNWYFDPIVDVPAFPCFYPPATPTALKVTPRSATSLRLTWSGDSFNTAGFHIARQAAGQGYTIIATVSGDASHFIDKHLTPGTTYSYKVMAFNSAGISRFSNPVTFTLPSARPPIGWIDLASAGMLKGWALDPDTSGRSVIVTASIDGISLGGQKAAGYRPDLLRAHGSAAHGFSFALPALATGIHRVDVFAFDTTSGARSLIGSRTIVTQRPAPRPPIAPRAFWIPRPRWTVAPYFPLWLRWPAVQ